MRNDLDETARSHLRRVLGEMESFAPLAPDLEPRVQELTRPARIAPMPLVVALGSAVVVFALLLPIVLLLGSPPEVIDEDVAESVGEPTTISSAGEVEEGTTIPSERDEAWTVTNMPQLGTVLASTSDGVIAVSSNEVWMTTDGSKWQLWGRFDEEATVAEVVFDGSQLVAYGQVLTQEPSDDSERILTPAIWASSDGGRTWSRGDLTEFVRDISATPVGFVAAGFVAEHADSGFQITTGVMWTSSNGLAWEPGAMSDDPDGMSSKMSAVVWSNDQLIILGEQGPHEMTEDSAPAEPGNWQPVTWTSNDARTWTSAAANTNLVGNIETAENTPYGLIALTYWTTPQTKDNSGAWISQNGTDWTPLPMSDGNWAFSDIAVTQSDVVLTGYTNGSALAELENMLWHTIDGQSWTQLSVPSFEKDIRLHQVALSEPSNVLTIAGDDNGRTALVASQSLSPTDQD